MARLLRRARGPGGATGPGCLTGMIDGEGMLAVYRLRTKKRKGQHLIYYPLIAVSNTSKEAIEKLSEIVGEEYKSGEAKR